MKQSISGDALGEGTITALLKYDHPTQDKLAKIVIKHQLTKRQATKLFKAYDENPQMDLGEYVKEVKGTNQVEIPLGVLPEPLRAEVEQLEPLFLLNLELGRDPIQKHYHECLPVKLEALLRRRSTTWHYETSPYQGCVP